MIKRKPLLITLGIVAAAAALIVYSTRPEPLKVRVATAETGNIEELVANTRAGTVMACRRAQMSPAAAGQIAKLTVREGDKVKRGQLLLSLWNEDLMAEDKLARSEATAAVSRAESVCIQADNAERSAQRSEELRKTGVVSQEAVDQARSQAESLRADCVAAKANVDVSRERVAAIAASLERTQLFAPFDGVIVEVNGEVGEYVTPSPPGIPTLPAVDMADRSCFYVLAPIDEVDAPRIKQGMVARISLDSFKGRSFPAHVRRVSDYVLDVEKQARTVDVEASFDNAGDMADLLPGYSADAEVILGTRENVLRIPSEAVVENKKVFVLNGDHSVSEREIKIGLSNWDFSEVLDGLKAGEKVVTTPDRKGLAEGVKVEVEK